MKNSNTEVGLELEIYIFVLYVTRLRQFNNCVCYYQSSADDGLLPIPYLAQAEQDREWSIVRHQRKTDNNKLKYKIVLT